MLLLFSCVCALSGACAVVVAAVGALSGACAAVVAAVVGRGRIVVDAQFG